MPETFGVLDDLVHAGKLHHYGVSVEKVEEALEEYPNVKTVQTFRSSSTSSASDLQSYSSPETHHSPSGFSHAYHSPVEC